MKTRNCTGTACRDCTGYDWLDRCKRQKKWRWSGKHGCEVLEARFVDFSRLNPSDRPCPSYEPHGRRRLKDLLVEAYRTMTGRW